MAGTQNNRIFQVLVTKDNQTVAPVGTALSALAVGQVGVFDADTNLAINAAGAATVKKFFIAAGVDTTGDGVQDDIMKSAGTTVVKNGITDYNLKCYSIGRPQIMDFHTYEIACETAYGFKINFEGNDEIYSIYGSNQAGKTFVEQSACCGEGCACPDGDCVDITRKLVENINSQEEQLIIASYVDYQTGSPVVIPDLDAWVVSNPTLCPSIRLTTSPTAISSYCRTNLKYHFPREVRIEVAPIAGFDCTGTLVEVQEMAYEEGNGYDINNLESEARGWNGSRYRLSSLTGTELAEGFDNVAVKSGKYLQINLEYTKHSSSAFVEHETRLNTIMAVPCGETTTSNALLTVLDALTPNFDALLDDALEYVDCVSVITTSGIDDVTADGLA